MIVTPGYRQLGESSTLGGASSSGDSKVQRVAKMVTFEVETSDRVYYSLHLATTAAMLLESAGDVHLNTDEADDESDTTDGQLDDTVSSGALEALDSPIAHHIQRQRQPPK